MDSTAAEEVDTRAAKRARLTTPSAAGDDADLISGLDDDVLLRVLALVPDASDAARACALSRRWRGLWSRVPALRFASRAASWAARGPERRAAMEEFASFVDGVLAQRARSDDGAIETLSISYASDHAATKEELKQAVSVGAVIRGWIRHAFQLGVKSFVLDLPEYIFELGVDLDEPLASPVKLETMRLALGGRNLRRLPNIMLRFASLKDLSLQGIHIEPGIAHLLGHLVSTASCPRLQKLHMSKIFFGTDYEEEMRIEAGVLSELWMDDVGDLRSLKLLTPNLRVSHVNECSHEMLTISAPRLEELAISFQLGHPSKSLEVNGGLPCVRSLKICLRSHYCVSSHRQAEKNANVLLLKHCCSLTCLQVTLQGEEVSLARPYLSKLK
ncbi:unnamed protein product [Urochloa humidicola]